ncbi:MAG: hypothetical protein QM813_10395 [Verrucomicrobiota bacterium]
MSRILWICISLLAASAASVRATTNHQVMQAEYRLPEIRLEATSPEPFTSWEHFETAFQRNADRIFTDRFHPLQTTHWELAVDDFRTQPSRTASKALTRTLTTSARSAAVELPLVMWLEDRQGFLVDLLRSTVEENDEEAVNPLDPSYRVTEKSWWQRLADNKNIYFGVRPFRTSPYAYISSTIRNGDTLLLMAHVRYHYSNFAEHQFEVALSMPLSPGLALELGTAYQFTEHSEMSVVVLKLAKQIGQHGVMHAGIEVQEHPRFLAGISLPL